MNKINTNDDQKTAGVAGQSTASCYVPPAQVFCYGKELDHVKCLRCGRIHFVEKGQPLPEIGWCGCDNNARTS